MNAEIKKIMVPRYKVTVEMHALDCKKCEERKECSSDIKTAISNIYDDEEPCFTIQSVTRYFSRRKRAVVWASWCIYNEEQFPIVEYFNGDDKYGDDPEYQKAYSRVKEICKDRFNITLR